MTTPSTNRVGPPRAFNLADLFEVVADACPERLALVAGEVRLTYDELDRRANRLAHHLLDHGVGPGDHVGIYAWNRAEWIEAMLGAYKARAVPINVNYRYVEDELRYIFDNADLAALVFERSFTPRVEAVLPDVPRLRHLVVVDDQSEGETATIGAVPYEDALAGASPERDFGPRSPDDLYILYTGGTTGMPKGVMWRSEDIFFGAMGGGNFAGPARRAARRPRRRRREGARRGLRDGAPDARRWAVGHAHHPHHRGHGRALHRPPLRRRGDLAHRGARTGQLGDGRRRRHGPAARRGPRRADRASTSRRSR